MKFSITDLVTFTEEILNGKLHFLNSDRLKTRVITEGHKSDPVACKIFF